MDTSPITRIVDGIVLASAFLFNAIVLDADVFSICIAIGGSLSGAIVLAYFRRDVRKFEQVFKVLASAIGGLVLGTVLQQYLHIDSYNYRLGLFFFCSMLALVILRSLLTMTEKNAGELLKAIILRVFSLQIKEEKTRRRVSKLEDKVNDMKEGE